MEDAPEQLDPDAAAAEAEEREVFIWDLGGQQEYRLVHQLFLPETTLAMILFDPTRGRAAFEDVREWNLRLKKQTERPGAGQRMVKLLVGTKLDTGVSSRYCHVTNKFGAYVAQGVATRHEGSSDNQFLLSSKAESTIGVN